MDTSVVGDGINQLYSKIEGWTEALIAMIPNLILAILVFAIFWLISQWAFNAIKKLFLKTNFNENLENLFANFCKTLIICLGIIFALGILQLQKTVFSLLAGVGVIGLALGFAFQDLAANFISGIMLAVRSPIKIGDVIKINDTLGTVIDIRLRDTLVRNFDGQDIFIPNKDFTSNQFLNYSSYGLRKLTIAVGIGYENDPQKALPLIEDCLDKLEGIIKDPAPKAFVDGLGDSAVNINAYIWFKYPGGNILQIKNDALIAIKRALETNGFNIPFPIRTLELSAPIKELFDRQN